MPLKRIFTVDPQLHPGPWVLHLVVVWVLQGDTTWIQFSLVSAGCESDAPRCFLRFLHGCDTHAGPGGTGNRKWVVVLSVLYGRFLNENHLW